MEPVVLIYDFITLRRLHKITWIGIAVIIILQLTVTTVWGSPLWYKSMFNLTAPLMEKVIEVNLSDAQTDPLLGDYESPIGKMTISRDSGKIYLQFNGDEKLEMGARSENELFLNIESMNFYFVKGPDGKVTEATAKQVGQIYKMVKLERP